VTFGSSVSISGRHTCFGCVTGQGELQPLFDVNG
jgi:hypothetical protein